MTGQSLRTIITLSLVTAFVIVTHLMPGLDNSEIHAEVRNALHVIGFAVFAAIVFEVLPTTTLKAAIATVLLAFIVGGISECFQILMGKSIDLFDLLRDLAGVALYLCARILWHRSNVSERSSGLRYSLRALSVGLVVLILAPLGYILTVNTLIAANFPTILDFDGRWDSLFSFPMNSEIDVVDGTSPFFEFQGQVAEIQMLRRNSSGIYIEPVVSDWSSYQYLSMAVRLVNGSDKSRVDVRMIDGDHPGFRSRHQIGEAKVGDEPTVVKLALKGIDDIPGRPDLDPSNIRQVFIIGKGMRAGAVLIIDNIRLE